MKAMQYKSALVVLLGTIMAIPAYAQENTVRTGAGGISSEAASIENIRTVYEQMITTVNGVFNVTDNRITTTEAKLEDIRREINNIQTVNYRTETVYVDQTVDSSSGGDDGGGCG